MAEPVQTQPLEVSDFSGGKTDNYIAGKPNQFQDADNMVLLRHGDKAKLITRAGSDIYDYANYRLSTNSRVAHLAENELELFQFSGTKAYHLGVEITGPSANSCLNAGTNASYVSSGRWNKHLLVTNDAISTPQKIFMEGGVWKTRTLGLPPPAIAATTFTPAAGGSSYHFIYTFIRTDSYVVNGVTYREVSATSFKPAALVAAAFPISITGIPVLTNAGGGNYNLSSTIEIYRTTDNGTTSFYVGQVTNGTTTFSDNVSDAALQTNAALYTQGGVIDFDQAPQSKYVVVNSDTAYYLGVQDTDGFHGNRVRQSITGSLYASPASFYVDLPADITGAGVCNSNLIVFTARGTYRIDGKIDNLGQGSMIAKEINSTVGCVSHRSIVQTQSGLFFAGHDGFYVTDGSSVTKLSSQFPRSYAALTSTATQAARIYGQYDPVENRIWWAGTFSVASTDNDIIFVCHLEGPGAPFTTLSGGSDLTNFAPTSLLFYNGKMLRGDSRGYLFYHDNNLYTDPKVDITTAPVNWAKSAIIYDYRSCAYDFGTTKVRKWVPRIVVSADNVTNLSLAMFSNNDNSGVFNQLGEVRYAGSSTWGDGDLIWGDPNARWNYSVTIDHWRRFPAGGIRCSYKQVRMTNSYTLIDSSDTQGTVAVNSTTKVITLNTAGKTWSTNAIDYFINVGGTNNFKVVARTPTTVTVSDPTNLLTTTAATTWTLKGYKKNEILSLLSYAIDYAPMTMTQNAYRGA